MRRLLLVVAALLTLASPAQAQLSTNLTAYWACNESSTGSRADLHGSNTLTENGTGGVAAPATGAVYTNTCDFEDTESDYLGIADNADVSFGTGVSWTIIAWVKAESQPFTAMIVGKDGAATDGEIWLFYSGAASRYRVRMWAASGYGTETAISADTFGAPGTGAWHMIAVTNTSGGNLCISVNAGGQDCTATSGIYDSTGAFNIGVGRAVYGQFWDGLIGPVVLWKRALSAGDITSVYNSGAGMTYAAMTGGAAPTCTGGFLLRGVGGC